LSWPSAQIGAALGVGAVALTGSGVPVAIAAAALGGAVALVRSHPTAAWLGAAVASGSGGAVRHAAVRALLLVAGHAFAAGRWADGRSGAAGLALLLAGTLAALVVGSESAIPYIFILVTPWAVGRALREHGLVASRLAERVRELEEEREAHAQLSVRYERARIASELHDLVAHAISVTVVQAAAGQRLAAVDPDLTTEAFRAIAGAARQAEEDMGRLVVLLADETAIGEAPDLALLEELVTHASGTGLDVTLRLEGERGDLPAPVVTTAYRVVQESLTNALRYASGSAVGVLVGGDEEALEVEVVNGPAQRAVALTGHGTGSGLQGLRNRLGVCGGTLEAGPTAEGGWKVAARMPRLVASST
jgi:signal transduction histidine kinase